MLRTTTCVIAVCDTCGRVFDEDGDGVAHFATAAEARQELAESRRCDHELGEPACFCATDPGWQHLPDEQLRCYACENRRRCGELGHDWSPWGRCRGFGAAYAVPHRSCAGQRRRCWRCDREQHRLARPEEVSAR